MLEPSTVAETSEAIPAPTPAITALSAALTRAIMFPPFSWQSLYGWRAARIVLAHDDGEASGELFRRWTILFQTKCDRVAHEAQYQFTLASVLPLRVQNRYGDPESERHPSDSGVGTPVE